MENWMKAIRICSLAVAVLAAGAFTAKAAPIGGSGVESVQEAKQEEIAERVFRLHIVANSDAAGDQELKLAVKDAVIRYMRQSMGEETSAKRVQEWAREQQTQIRDIAEAVIREQGYRYETTVTVGQTVFPEKTYGDITLPAGSYDALRVVIGKGQGHNWWCVLYPNLCFLDATQGIVPQEGKEKLQAVLTEDEYDWLLHPEKYKVTMYFLSDRTGGE